jgi:hypothetical protein
LLVGHFLWWITFELLDKYQVDGGAIQRNIFAPTAGAQHSKSRAAVVKNGGGGVDGPPPMLSYSLVG